MDRFVYFILLLLLLLKTLLWDEQFFILEYNKEYLPAEQLEMGFKPYVWMLEVCHTPLTSIIIIVIYPTFSLNNNFIL